MRTLATPVLRGVIGTFLALVILQPRLYAQTPEPGVNVPELRLAESFGGEWGYADGPLAEARFNRPQGMAVDAFGRIIVADTYNHCVRMIDDDDERTVYTLIGACGQAGRLPANPDAGDLYPTDARLDHPVDVAVDRRRQFVYVLDSGNNRILRHSPDGVREIALQNPDEIFSLTNALGVGCDENGWLFIADSGNHRVLFYDRESEFTQIMAGTGEPGYDMNERDGARSRLFSPTDVQRYPTGPEFRALFVLDSRNDLLRWLRQGEQTPWLISVFSGGDNVVYRREEPGPGQLFHLERPYRIVFSVHEGREMLWVSQPTKRRILGITLVRNVYFAAGTGSEHPEDLEIPYGMTYDGLGNLWVFDSGARLKRFEIVEPQ